LIKPSIPFSTVIALRYITYTNSINVVQIAMSKSSNPGDLDKTPKDKQSDSDNPFIRFRHFADEQIGAVLQGFVGLPSAFSKPQSGSQWSVFDEDLKRRDALQARRRELKEAEEARSENRTVSEDEEVQIPVKKSQSSHGEGDFVHFLHDQWTNVFGSADIPLYSPLHSPLANPFSGNLRHTMSSFAAMMLYKADPDDISLVPYLLGSPYSLPSSNLFHTRIVVSTLPSSLVKCSTVELEETSLFGPLGSESDLPLVLLASCGPEELDLRDSSNCTLLPFIIFSTAVRVDSIVAKN